MRYIVLFQHSCRACSNVAKMVRDLEIAGLEARPLDDPEISARLSKARLPIPDRPSLMVVGEDDMRVLSGWGMRRRLAVLVGWRRSRAIVRLLAAEYRARLARAAQPDAPSRRGVIGSAIAGLVGWAVLSRSAFDSPRPEDGATTPADASDVRAALAAPSVQQAIRTWGPVEGTAYITRSGGQSTLALTHPGQGIVTFVDNSPGALRNRPVALSMGLLPDAGGTIRYHTVGGVPLADVTASGDRVRVSAVDGGPDGPDRPSTAQMIIFWACIIEHATADCVIACQGCNPAGTLAEKVNCTKCLACAGPYAVKCGKRAFGEPKP
jgi:hypothetical protein